MTKGKYITTSLLLAALSGGKHGRTVLVDETPAKTKDHIMIWSKTVSTAQQKMAATKKPDELKTV